ncbi:MAG: Fe-S cluster assembly protein SufD [Bacteroidales bacterium]|nr:Fe-S cluster assembly protein SufD [Bacteroidales bacterium]
METMKKMLLDYADAEMRNISAHDTAKVAAMRAEALKRFAESGFPTRKMEHWRNSKIVGNQEYNFSIGKESTCKSCHDFSCVIKDFDTEVIKMKNGVFDEDESLRTLESGVIIGSTMAAMQKYPEIFDKYFGTCKLDEANGFYDINTALWQDGFFIFVPRNVVGKKPIQIIKLIDNKEIPFIQTRNIIILEENSQLTIVDCDDTKCHQASMINSYTEMILGENAHLESYKMQNLNDNTILLNTNTAKQLSNSTLQSCIISFNGGRIRNNIHVDLDGEGSDLQIYGLYLMDKQQHVDNQLKINHNVPNCTSNEKFKGILDNEATAVFNGHVLVAPNAQKTNAYQNNSNIILTDKAKVNTMPFLEIYADDVKCSHGTSTGQLDQEAMFYMRQRGIKKEDARMLLMYAFAAEISNHVNISALRERIDDMIQRRLKGELSSCDTCAFQCGQKEYDFKLDLDKI